MNIAERMFLDSLCFFATIGLFIYVAWNAPSLFSLWVG